ncbi:hypothetical protein RRF57_009376 [Xylaria bambusicola]|uniref:Uncharacterized protein n=1 Tax=Xylaria bambusicola TaxID=326684 RepID=A0AAN7Z7T4_9PEZI
MLRNGLLLRQFVDESSLSRSGEEGILGTRVTAEVAAVTKLPEFVIFSTWLRVHTAVTLLHLEHRDFEIGLDVLRALGVIRDWMAFDRDTYPVLEKSARDLAVSGHVPTPRRGLAALCAG